MGAPVVDVYGTARLHVVCGYLGYGAVQLLPGSFGGRSAAPTRSRTSPAPTRCRSELLEDTLADSEADELLPLCTLMQFIPDEQGTFMEWSFEGVTCHGVFKPEASVAILNFCLQESMVTITYRVLDANSELVGY
ncbi:unnamed protein product [Phytophthora lilii]|uniref:Unnamed protein product n=1 Tax=Phytophthora lilii TaxID=2077276 RepID=A0A9W6TAG9_9STRA|nr:unnamed protein product [Phytophthora lilii]